MNYAQPAFFYITLCTKDRQRVFGKVRNSQMHLSEGGQVAKECWEAIPMHFPEVKLHEYIIMPDHIHGIIEITTHRTHQSGGIQQIEPQLRNQYQHVIPGSVGAIVRGFKIGVTKWFKEHKGIHPVWQRNYYEQIIRSKIAFENITRYIMDNPKNWKP